MVDIGRFSYWYYALTIQSNALRVNTNFDRNGLLALFLRFVYLWEVWWFESARKHKRFLYLVNVVHSFFASSLKVSLSKNFKAWSLLKTNRFCFLFPSHFGSQRDWPAEWKSEVKIYFYFFTSIHFYFLSFASKLEQASHHYSVFNFSTCCNWFKYSQICQFDSQLIFRFSKLFLQPISSRFTHFIFLENFLNS